MSLSSDEASAVAQAVVAELVRGEFAAVSQRFAAKLRVVGAELLQLAWKQIALEAGPFLSIVSSHPEPADDPELCLVTSTCAFERGLLFACMLVDGEKRLNALWFHAQQA